MIIKPNVLTSDELFNSLGECDFNICYNGYKSCKCHFSIVAAASMAIRELDNNGNRPTQIILYSKNELTCVEDVINFFYGSKLKINPDNINELVNVGYLLKSHILLREVIPPYIFFQKKEKVENELISAKNILMTNPSSIKFAAQFFNWFISDITFISKIHESILCQLISHPDCRIESEDYLLEKLIAAKAPLSAFRHIRYEFITPKGYQKIFDYFNPLPDVIFEILKDRFSYSSRDDPSTNPRFVPSDSFRDLIFEYVSPKLRVQSQT